MADTYVISPIDIATQGLLSDNTLTIATQGFIVKITEEIIEVPGDIAGGGITTPAHGDDEFLVKKKLITVRVYKDDKEFWQTKEVVDRNVRIEDIQILISKDKENKPIITVEYPI